MGAEVARQLASSGDSVAGFDVDEQGLGSLRQELEEGPGEHLLATLDVCDRGGILEFRDRVLEKYGPLWLVTQFNHPHEITTEAARACERLLRCGVPVNNQTVLLRDVNDQSNTIMRLCQGLLRIRVRPYYLHQCDPVVGSEHFRTPISKGIELIACMQGYTSGLAVPKFVVDLAGRGGKVSMQPESIVSQEGNRVFLRNYAGEVFSYEDASWPIHSPETFVRNAASIV